MIRLLCLIFLLSGAHAVLAQTEYTRHRVKSGEDLLTIARLYSVNVGQLLKANPGTVHHELSRGEIIYIPHKTSKPTLNDGRKKIKGYRVKAGETLHGICQKYRMDLGQIMHLNGMRDSAVRAGQRILVITDVKHQDFFDVPDWMLRPAQPPPKQTLHLHQVKAGETLYSIANKYGVSQEEIRKQNGLQDHYIRVGQSLSIRVNNPQTATASSQEILEDLVPEPTPAVRVEESKPEPLIYESGVGERIEQKRNSDQKIALHRSAEIGSFIRVHNESRGTYCTVRVIGHFPDIEANKNVIIKISEAACRQLGIVNNRFPIVLSRPAEK